MSNMKKKNEQNDEEHRLVIEAKLELVYTHKGEATCRLTKSVVASATTKKLQQHNIVALTRRRFCCNKEDQARSGKSFASLLSKTELESMVNSMQLFQTWARMDYIRLLANWPLDRIRF